MTLDRISSPNGSNNHRRVEAHCRRGRFFDNIFNALNRHQSKLRVYFINTTSSLYHLAHDRRNCRAVHLAVNEAFMMEAYSVVRGSWHTGTHDGVGHAAS